MAATYHKLNSPNTVRRNLCELSRGKKLTGLLLIVMAVFSLYFLNIQTAQPDELIDATISGFSVNISDVFVTALTSPVTVVTAYYHVSSKKDKKAYMHFIQNFFPNIPCFLYVFTNAESAAELRALRTPHLNRTRFMIMELEEFREYSRMDAWRRVKKIDPESYHSPELYLVWNEKWRFVQRAIQENAFHSEYFLWCDVGSFRSPENLPVLRAFPDPKVVAARLTDPKKITVLVLRPFDRTEYVDEKGLPSDVLKKGQVDHIGAGIVAGQKSAWEIWIEHYYEMQKIYLEHGLNAGKEQNVMNAVVLRYPQNVQMITPKPYFDGRGDGWFYLQYYFSVMAS